MARSDFLSTNTARKNGFVRMKKRVHYLMGWDESRPQPNETEKLLNEALSGENEKSMKAQRRKAHFSSSWGLSRQRKSTFN